MTKDLWFDRSGEEIVRQFDLSQEQASRLEELVQRYRLRRHQLLQKSITYGIDAKKSTGLIWGGQREQITYAKSIIALMDLHYEQLRLVAEMLDAKQRAKWKDAIDSEWNKNLFRQVLMWPSVNALGDEIIQPHLGKYITKEGNAIRHRPRSSNNHKK